MCVFSIKCCHGYITKQAFDDCTACSGANDSSTLGKLNKLHLINYCTLTYTQEGMIERHVKALKELANNNKQGFVSLATNFI